MLPPPAKQAFDLCRRQADLRHWPPVPQQHRHHVAVALQQLRLGIDVTVAELEAVRGEDRPHDLLHLPAEVTLDPGDELEGSRYSHSMVAGGLLVTSYTTRFTPSTSLTIRLAVRPSRSAGKGYQSAVMKSCVSTARSATTLS